MAQKVWFITGTSRGFGHEWTEAVLERGDKVAATARNLDSLDDLAGKYGDAILPIKLDVSDREAAFAAVAQAQQHFGRLDVVVNNAGYGQFGLVEELSETGGPGPDRHQPVRRALGHPGRTAVPARAGVSGHIIQVSSIGGISAFPNVGIYNASKWALGGHQPGIGPGGRRTSASRSPWWNPPDSPPTGAESSAKLTPRRSRPTTSSARRPQKARASPDRPRTRAIRQAIQGSRS